MSEGEQADSATNEDDAEIMRRLDERLSSGRTFFECEELLRKAIGALENYRSHAAAAAAIGMSLAQHELFLLYCVSNGLEKRVAEYDSTRAGVERQDATVRVNKIIAELNESPELAKLTVQALKNYK